MHFEEVPTLGRVPPQSYATIAFHAREDVNLTLADEQSVESVLTKEKYLVVLWSGNAGNDKYPSQSTIGVLCHRQLRQLLLSISVQIPCVLEGCVIGLDFCTLLWRKRRGWRFAR
jgi:hypothetical protein